MGMVLVVTMMPGTSLGITSDTRPAPWLKRRFS